VTDNAYRGGPGGVLPRAAQLYIIEERPSDSAGVGGVWRTRGVLAQGFISVAATHWEIVFTKERGRTYATIRGPETRATPVPITTGEGEFFGVSFKLGAFMPSFPPDRLVDGSLELPRAGDDSFWLNGSAWQYPRFEDADLFVRRLEREGLLVQDPLVGAAFRGDLPTPELSLRSVQRRIVRATGLTRATIGQIERAERAVALLERGVPPIEVVVLTGYADQPHMTRALKRLVGQTPGQIARGVSRR
jgi:hypothetical protein